MNPVDQPIPALLSQQIEIAIQPLTEIISQLREENKSIKDELIIIKSEQTEYINLIKSLLHRIESLEQSSKLLIANAQKSDDEQPEKVDKGIRILNSLPDNASQITDSMQQMLNQQQDKKQISNNVQQQQVEQKSRLDSKEETYFRTKTGLKYHKIGCGSLTSLNYPLTQKEALKQGLTQCEICKYHQAYQYRI